MVTALLNITDSRFQETLMASAKAVGKLPADYVIPDAYHDNTPQRLSGLHRLHRAQRFLPGLPMGSDFTYLE